MSKKRSYAHLRKYWFKKKGRGKRAKSRRKHGHPMAKKRRKSSHRRRHSARRTHRRRRHGGGGGYALMPSREQLHLMGAGAAIGFLESDAKADAAHVLNKIPRPVHQLGYTGGTALALHVLAHFTKNRWIALGARAASVAAAYQIGRNKGLLTSSDSVSGISDGGDEAFIGDDEMGALDSEGTSMDGWDDVSGAVAYDDAVLNQS